MYKLIFSIGHDYEDELVYKQVRGDILIELNGQFFRPTFITLDRIKAEFSISTPCFLNEDLVIVRSVSKNTVIESMRYLHEWKFYEKWIAVRLEFVERFFYPKERWIIYEFNLTLF